MHLKLNTQLQAILHYLLFQHVQYETASCSIEKYQN